MAIDELAAFFSSIQLPDTIEIGQGAKIINVPDFIENHLNYLMLNSDAPSVSVFYERLLMIRDLLADNISG